MIDEAGRDRKGGQAGQVDRHGIDIREIHADWIIHPFIQFKRRAGRCRPNDDIDLVEGIPEIITYQMPDLLCLEIIGIIVAGREYIGSDHDPAFHFPAKTFATGTAKEIIQIFRICTSIAITHSIITCQV